MRLLAVRLQNLNSHRGAHLERFDQMPLRLECFCRAGGSQEMSRWCNHRNHADTPSILRCVLEGREKGTNAKRPSNASRAPSGARWLGHGGWSRNRWLHHRLGSHEPPARAAASPRILSVDSKTFSNRCTRLAKFVPWLNPFSTSGGALM
jgi:hypothetical protein